MSSGRMSPRRSNDAGPKMTLHRGRGGPDQPSLFAGMAERVLARRAEIAILTRSPALQLGTKPYYQLDEVLALLRKIA
jgi:hypothetical protein